MGERRHFVASFVGNFVERNRESSRKDAKTQRREEVLKLGSSKVLKSGWRPYRAALLVLNRQDAKSAKIGNREWTRIHANEFDGAAGRGTAKNAKSAKEAPRMHECTRKWSKRVDEVYRLRVGLREGLSGAPRLLLLIIRLSRMIEEGKRRGDTTAAAGSGVMAARADGKNACPRSEYRLQAEVVQGLQPRSHDPFFQGKKGFAGLKALAGFRLKPVLRPSFPKLCHAPSGLVCFRLITQGVALGWYVTPFQGFHELCPLPCHWLKIKRVD